jgi:hypothetical protein
VGKHNCARLTHFLCTRSDTGTTACRLLPEFKAVVHQTFAPGLAVLVLMCLQLFELQAAIHFLSFFPIFAIHLKYRLLSQAGFSMFDKFWGAD